MKRGAPGMNPIGYQNKMDGRCTLKRSRTSELISGSPVRPFRALLFLLLVAMASLPACRNTATSATPPPPVDVMEVLRRDVPIYQEWIGTADGMVNATIRPQVTGYLTRQDYKEGDFVHSGQVLFEIDPRTFQAALAQADAQESQARGQLAQAEAQHTNALANLDRIRPLADQNAVSKKDLDDAIGAEGSSQAAVVAARANVGAARAAAEKVRLDLGFTMIISPIDGIAGIAKAQVGNLVGPAQGGELTTVSKIDPIKIYITTSEQAYIVSRRQFSKQTTAFERDKGLPYELILADGSIYPHKGMFYALDRQVDERTGTLRLAVLFPNPGNLIRPGQFARVRMAAGTKKGALLVPQRAVSELQGSYQVAVVGQDNRAEIRAVKTSERIGALWVIDEGMKPGERVVVEGVQKVRQGALVTPKPVAPELRAKFEAVPNTEGRPVPTLTK